MPIKNIYNGTKYNLAMKLYIFSFDIQIHSIFLSNGRIAIKKLAKKGQIIKNLPYVRIVQIYVITQM